MADDEYNVALWYIRYGSPDYELCEDEEEAAQSAVFMEDHGHGVVLGVQFPDGRIVERDRWDARKAAVAARREEEASERAARAAAPRPVMRKARDPFEHRSLEIEASEPSWVGDPE